MPLNNDDDDFDISKVPLLQKLVGDKETDDSVTPEGSPIDSLVSGGVSALGGKALAEGAASALEPYLQSATSDAGQVLGNEAGSLDLSGLNKIMQGATGAADDVAGSLAPSSTTGPNELAMPTQVQSRNVDMQQRLKQQMAATKLAALQKYLQNQ